MINGIFFIYLDMFNVVSRIITGQEIATLQEAKTYFRTEDSGGVEDALILSLVKLARETIEGKIDRSLVASNVEVFASNWKGYLPYGPVLTYNIDGIATVQGNKYLLVNASENVTITYTTGAYVAAELKNAVLELALYWYERGEFTGGEVPAKIKPIIRQHSRLSFIG